MKIICLFNLRPNVDPQDYLRWARERDIPNVRSLDAVHSFSVSRITRRLRSEQAAPYQYVEIIEITSLEDFQKGARAEVFQNVASMFSEFTDDPVFMLAESIEA